MRILAFSDWRVQSIDVLFKIITKIKNVDVIVYAGDDLNRFDKHLFIENIKKELQKYTKCKKSFIFKVDETTFCYKFSRYPDTTSEDKLKELANSEINGQNCKIPLEIFKTIAGSTYELGTGQTEAVKYKLKVGIESGRLIDIDGKNIIVFTIDNQTNIIPVIDFPNIFQELSKMKDVPILGVIGNDDTEKCRSALNGINVFNLHEKPIKVGEQCFIGIHGDICDDIAFDWRSNPSSMNNEKGPKKNKMLNRCLGHVVMNESDAKTHLERQILECDNSPIIVSHTPPHGVLDISMRYGIGHIGSVELRNFIKSHRIPLVICGHVHGYGGYTRNIGKTTVVNVSSHDKVGSEGNIAIIDYQKKVEVKWIKISNYDESLRKIKDIGIYKELLLSNNGINTIDDLTKSDDELLMGLKTRLLTSTELQKIFCLADNDEEELILTLLFKYNLSLVELKKFKRKNFKNFFIHFYKSHGIGENKKIFLDEKTSDQIIAYISNRDFIDKNPIFFSSKEDMASFEKLSEKLNMVFTGYREPKGGIGKIFGKQLIERANAYNKDELIIYARKKHLKNIIYVDIETSPFGIEQSFFDLGKFYIYLIGIYDEENGYQCFITKDKKPNEKMILEQFINYLQSRMDNKFVLCAYNGNKFDFKHLEKKLIEKSLDLRTFRQIEKIDLLEISRKNMYVPKGNSLPVVASYFGYSFKNPDKNGYQMGVEYQGFILGTLDKPDWEKIIENNRDDVLAMKYIIKNTSL